MAAIGAVPSGFFEKEADQEDSDYKTSHSTQYKVSKWLIENRGGMDSLAGLKMVPSECLGKGADLQEVAERAQKRKAFTLTEFALEVEKGKLRGAVYYPPNMEKSERCILYHNPNGTTMEHYFDPSTGAFGGVPAQLSAIKKCPVILYDYRGTGKSRQSSTEPWSPTYLTLLADGGAVLRYAAENFTYIDVVGTSLGGGVATVSLGSYIESKPNEASFINLLNHDSFSSTAQVARPSSWTRGVNFFGWVWGGLIDAQGAMKKLIEREVRVIVLSRQEDSVIPAGAKMGDFIQTIQPFPKRVKRFESSHFGHGDLSRDMVRFLSSNWR